MQVLKKFKKYKYVENIEEYFEIESVLGSGSFGDVFLATHQKLQIECAVKKINKDQMAIDPIYDELMKEEIAILSNISHPNLMRVYELLQDYDHIYIVTEYIKGGELQETLKRIKKFEEEKAALIIY